MTLNHSGFDGYGIQTMFESVEIFKYLATLYRAHKEVERHATLPVTDDIQDWILLQIWERYRTVCLPARQIGISISCEHLDIPQPKFHFGEKVQLEHETAIVHGMTYHDSGVSPGWQYRLRTKENFSTSRHEDDIDRPPSPQTYRPLTRYERRTLEAVRTPPPLSQRQLAIVEGIIQIIEAKHGSFLPQIESPEADEG